MKRFAVPLLLAGASLLLYVGLFIGKPEPTDGTYIIRFLILSQLLFGAYWGLLTTVRKYDLGGHDRRLLYTLIAIALLTRLVVVFGAGESTILSDDVYRYIWEGKLVAHGQNPFVVSPEDMCGSALADDTIYPQINHPWLPTIYPPLSQYFFLIAWLIGGDSLLGFKLLSFLFELLTAGAILVMIRRFKLPLWTWFIWLFSPLVILEFLFSNHLDILAMPFFVVALVAFSDRRLFTTGLFLGLAASVKLFAFFVLPVLFFLTPGWRQRLSLAFTCLGIFVLLYLPFLWSAGINLFGSLWEYLGSWQYNGSLFALDKALFGEQTARIISGTLFVVAVTVLSLWRRNQGHPLRRAFWVFGAYVILTPSLFSWYLVWLLPFLVIFRAGAFLLLTGTVFLAYHVLIGYYNVGQWTEYGWLRAAEYVPFYSALLWWVIRSRKMDIRV